MLKKEERENYKENIRLFTAKTRFLKHGTLAFLAGGFISVAGQLIYDGLRLFFSLNPQMATSYMIVILLTISAFGTGFGIYKKGAQLFGAGLIVPITGFANAMTATALDHRSEGFLSGIGVHLFRIVGPIFIVGITAAYLVSFSRLFIHMILK
ncbi:MULTISPECIES: SpoVA/SpoVAEb family sporulation membrane protein [Shouchella]|uniref:Stage V sporulation protein AC n=4 Tax=Bacillaceae TaxID=186817 RepID=A0A060LVG2_9BACI|nr:MULTISPECIES: SpoVA/SpoVAEb family sporulation membrane protein [Bacillaceae]RQW20116.1 SpoVA/SpoVAEb family sporulation membrane protein [Bacillus sp. C1-1]AIC94207.1 Stage V sporulation protein AC [Shouchella lehensis G1]KQL58067.1 stage V sporulation protein AC [Alkalicoccobacillus plakortidis]MBG9785824.1 stage V sporulation protein AC [Shouchella lehensis]MED4129944.1 SpoVA/SpoVAEb family sporulation membrane protein [Shouchella miscanthi]